MVFSTLPRKRLRLCSVSLRCQIFHVLALVPLHTQHIHTSDRINHLCDINVDLVLLIAECRAMRGDIPYPEPVVFQWQSSGNPVCLALKPQCTLECHWRKNIGCQCASSGFPVVFQCVPIMQINTGSPLGRHWVLASASVVPVAFQCTCGSSGLPVRSNYAN